MAKAVIKTSGEPKEGSSQLKLKTGKFQEMVSKAVKGASNNKMIPITGLLAISLKDNTLTLTTTDATNTLKIIEKNIEGSSFYVVIQAEQFSKLVAKTTSEYITLTLRENTLEFRGNGAYMIELPLDEEGKLIKFPEYKFDTKAEELTIHLSTIKVMLSSNKVALAETMEMPCLTGYYCSEGIVTTDTFKVCKTNIKVCDEPILLPNELVNLLSLADEEKIILQRDKNKVLFTAGNVVVYGNQLDGIEDYPIEAIEDYVQTEFESVCKISKQTLLNVLDRIKLFVSTYDKNGVYLTFTKDGLICSSKKSNGTELISYQESQNFQAYSCCIDIELFHSQISAQSGDVVELWYGHETAIKMTSGNITQIIALLEDDREVDDSEIANGENNS